MNRNSCIYVAGGTGLVGSAIIQELIKKEYSNIVSNFHNKKPIKSYPVKWIRLDLIDQAATANFFAKYKPEFVFLCAAKVGGIAANDKYRADFIYENLQIQNNIIHQSYVHKVKKLLFLGSTCIYPRESPQPINEKFLLTSPLEYTNEPYAIAKIAGIKMCESYNIQYRTNFVCAMPTNLYGPEDNFDLEKSHVLPALIRKMHLAKLLSEKKYNEIVNDLKIDSIEKTKEYLNKFGVNENKVEIWGTGRPKREFLYSEDMANACVFLMEHINFRDISNNCEKEIRNTHINIGTGKDISIKELAILIKEIVGFKGELCFNPEKPDGTMQKLTDVTKLNKLGWKYKTELKQGIERVYEMYKATF